MSTTAAFDSTTGARTSDGLLSPATPLQAGMYFHAVAHPGTGVDVEHVTLTASAAVDVDRFLGAWRDVLDDFAELRAVVRLVDGRPWIAASESEPFTYETYDLADSSDPAADVAEVHTADRQRGFDLLNGPLMRFSICNLPDGAASILWSFHHLLLDGRSFPLVLERVISAYDGQPARPAPDVSMADYATALSTTDHTAAKQGWADKLQALDGPSSIPATGPEVGGVVEAIEQRLGDELSTGVRSLAASAGVSVHTVVQAAWSLLLRHHSQKSSVVFGSTRAGRHVVAGAEDTIGLLILTVPFMVNFEGTPTTLDLLAQIRDEQRALRDLETAPLDQIQKASGFGTTPLFESLVMYDDATLDTRMQARLGTDTNWSFDYAGQTNFPLTLLAYGEEDILVRLEHDTSRFDAEAANMLMGRLTNVLGSMVVEPDVPAVSLDYFTPNDYDVLAEWNATDNDWDQSSTLVDLLEQQSKATPDSPAITFRDRTYTYAEFDQLSTSLAAHLRTLGVGADVLVGVAADRSIELELCIHAIVKAGGGFVPLDPNLPDERLAMMAADASIALVLAQDQHGSRPAFERLDVLAVLADDPSWDTSAELDYRPDARDLAYALFTSGSTGKPKCAANEHRAIVNRLRWMQDAFPLDGTDVVLQKTPYSFDVSVWEHFWALCVGAHLVIAEPGAHHDPRVLARAITEADVTTIHFVPSMLQLFVEEPAIAECTSLRRIIASGEALPRSLQDKVFAALDTELHNLYGPTEAAIDVTWWACDPDTELAHIPIGAAIANTQIHILDENRRPVPAGVSGELYIGGVQVGRGYVNQPELTAERFVPDPFGYDDQIYATGDLARFMDDGNVEYLGRLDHQVKVRGLRIELGEIEVVIGAAAGVRETVVVAREDQPGVQQIVGYVVGDNIDAEQLRDHCAKKLPTWMIPDQWVMLDALPLNTSGKVDRKVLPAPALASRKDTPLESDAERRVGAIWIDILGHDNVGPMDPFFDVGGTSLDLVRLAVALGDDLGRDIGVVDLLRVVTIRGQASEFVEGKTEPDQAILRSRQQADARRGVRKRSRAVRR